MMAVGRRIANGAAAPAASYKHEKGAGDDAERKRGWFGDVVEDNLSVRRTADKEFIKHRAVE